MNIRKLKKSCESDNIPNPFNPKIFIFAKRIETEEELIKISEASDFGLIHHGVYFKNGRVISTVRINIFDKYQFHLSVKIKWTKFEKLFIEFINLFSDSEFKDILIYI